MDTGEGKCDGAEVGFIHPSKQGRPGPQPGLWAS